MTVRTVTINSMEDLDAIPEDEWVWAPGGINIPFDYSHFRQARWWWRFRPTAWVLDRIVPLRGRVPDDDP